MAVRPVLDPRWRDLESIGQYSALATPDRRALMAAICAALGPAFVPGSELLGSMGLPAVVHGATATTFAVIPGGEFLMGVRPEEHVELVAIINRAAGDELDGDVDDLLQVALPVHRVSVRPFLLAIRPVLVEQARSLSPVLAALPVGLGRFERLDEAACIKPFEVASVLAGAPPGFRLACEAEWEWVAREGGPRSWIVHPRDWLAYESGDDAPNAMGVQVTADFGEYCSDGWFPNHQGAPSLAVARSPEPQPGVARGPHSGWEDAIEVVAVACGYREQASEDDDRWMRFACDLP